MTPPLSRRDFLAASSSVLALGGSSLLADEVNEPSASQTSKSVSANDKIRLGFVGVGGMGTGLLNIFRKFPDVEVVALCDVHEPHLLRAKELSGGKAHIVGDFRRVLDRKDVDAVVVATPDHWHAIPTIMACLAEKDVYCEKPLSYRIAEGQAMVKAAAKTKRVTQMGNLIHAGENYRRVVEIVRSGILGPITKTRVWMAADRRGLGKPADCAPPAGVDYDFWLGPAPLRAFNPNRFTFNWRWYWDYAGGLLMDFVCHIVDLVHWAMDVQAPRTITSTGGRYALEDNGETPDTLEVVYHYDKGKTPFDLVWSHADASPHGFEGRSQGIMFQGTEATLVSGYNDYKIYGGKGWKEELPPRSIPKSVGHHREWLDAIKTRGATTCNFNYGHRLTSVGHLGNIALWTNEKLVWDAETEKVTNHAEANQYLARAEYRKPWVLPTV